MRRFVRPYAEALLATAGSVEQAGAVRDELAGFARMMAQTPALRRMAVHPAVPIEAKERALEAIGEQAGLTPLTRRFLGALLRRYRLGRLDEIVAGLTELLNRRLGVAVAEVASAQPLSDQEQAELREVLEGKLDRQVELRLAVDPALLGGFVVQVDSTRWDASLQGQLTRLTRELVQQAGAAPSTPGHCERGAIEDATQSG
jgi:F-type H+-transporting ATPase subunit delta